MSALGDAMEALVAAVSGVEGLKGYRGDQIGQMQLPAVVVGLPTVKAETYCTAPTSATFPVTVIARIDSGVMDTLFARLPEVWAAIQDNTRAVAGEAFPVSFDLGNNISAGGYEITVEYPL